MLDSSNPDKWRVATYVFTPGTMTVYEGDTVELTTFIVNGNYHFTRLVAPDGTEVDAIEMNRGREYKLSFVADQAGTYQLICDTHAPTMRAYITAVPRKLSYLGSESFCEGCVA
ncbi:MAG: hypothetical protein IIC81_10855 [Chloroflexi bacterium]|nr:hypothetical protein [Chloroflexota bacterium]